MIVRLVVLVCLMLPAGCGPLAGRELPSCWVNKSYRDGERVAGRVTLIISDQADFLMDSPSILVSPLTCENGSFLVRNPPPELLKLRKAWSEDRALFGSVYEADVRGTVRVIPWQTHAGQAGGPYSIEISKVGGLKPIRYPRWWKP